MRFVTPCVQHVTATHPAACPQGGLMASWSVTPSPDSVTARCASLVRCVTRVRRDTGTLTAAQVHTTLPLSYVGSIQYFKLCLVSMLKVCPSSTWGFLFFQNVTLGHWLYEVNWLTFGINLFGWICSCQSQLLWRDSIAYSLMLLQYQHTARYFGLINHW